MRADATPTATIVQMRSLMDALHVRLRSPLPGLHAQLRLAPRPRLWPEPGAVLRPAAALLLLYPHDGRWFIPLTVRSSGLRHHTGQVSLPGGRLDRADETVEEAALREAREEIGVAEASVRLLGRLTPVPVAISGHLLTPVLGTAASRPAFMLEGSEVERLIEVPVERLFAPDAVAWEERVRAAPAAGRIQVPYFDIDGAHVWGATAMVLAEFIALIDDLRPTASLRL